ncbi:MAG: mannitol-1-phosphate 5-dehydrogenase [Bacteroidia bacterium]|nr:mannitol-1-phosphate 5-dehydrogenase [Bacteroidia bacterium]
MYNTKNKSDIDSGKIVIFGAGKIGRSFLGQLFGCAGYRVVFVDVDSVLVERLNKRGSYPVIIKGETEQEIIVPNVSAILAFDKDKVSEAVASTGILSVNVGKNALGKVIPIIAEGLKIRYVRHPNAPLDIILAENMRDAAQFVREQLMLSLPENYPIEKLVGLVETSIGKMVPIMPLAEMEKDPLMVFAEPYNSLILDQKGFRSSIPAVKGLSPKANIKAWVDRKAFIHNLGHATAAYYGNFLHPEMIYMYEVLDDPEVLSFTREVMLQSAAVLLKYYPEDFTLNDLVVHTDDLIRRFRNKALKDTIYRVGQDLTRKLGEGDRFMGVIRLAIGKKLPYDLILRALSYGFFFQATNEEGQMTESDRIFLKKLSVDFEDALTSFLLLDPNSDAQLIFELAEFRNQLKIILKHHG